MYTLAEPIVESKKYQVATELQELEGDILTVVSR